jgi:hypothetical protein
MYCLMVPVTLCPAACCTPPRYGARTTGTEIVTSIESTAMFPMILFIRRILLRLVWRDRFSGYGNVNEDGLPVRAILLEDHGDGTVHFVRR